MITTLEDYEELTFEGLLDDLLREDLLKAVDRLYDDEGECVHRWIIKHHSDEDGNFDPIEEDSMKDVAWNAAHNAKRENNTIRARLDEECNNKNEEELALIYLGQRATNNGSH